MGGEIFSNEIGANGQLAVSAINEHCEPNAARAAKGHHGIDGSPHGAAGAAVTPNEAAQELGAVALWNGATAPSSGSTPSDSWPRHATLLHYTGTGRVELGFGFVLTEADFNIGGRDLLYPEGAD